MTSFIIQKFNNYLLSTYNMYWEHIRKQNTQEVYILAKWD